MLQRHSVPPPIEFQARTLLTDAAVLTINSLLKDLMRCAKKQQTSLASFRSELQVLERLYYKGKNQHRSALFWKRVSEVRSYAKRIDQFLEINLSEYLHHSFFGSGWKDNPKVLKGAWFSYPGRKTVVHVQTRSSDIAALLMKARTQFKSAYEFLLVTMRSAVFLDLILTLVAITSRLDILASGLLESAQLSELIASQALKSLYNINLNVLIIPDDPLEVKAPPIAYESELKRPRQDIIEHTSKRPAPDPHPSKTKKKKNRKKDEIDDIFGF